MNNDVLTVSLNSSRRAALILSVGKDSRVLGRDLTSAQAEAVIEKLRAQWIANGYGPLTVRYL